MWALRVLQSVLLVIGIEVRAGRFKPWPFAFCHLVKMDCVHSRREVLQSELDTHSLARVRQCGSTDRLALRVLQFNSVTGVLRRNIRQQTADEDRGNETN